MARALEVVRKLMAFPQAQQLFNTPVDAEALGLADYHDIVEHPMDLGSIEASLAEGELVQYETCEYDSPEHVLQAINLVWSNCVSYNTRPDELPIADAARELAQSTVELWRKAGLDSTRGTPRGATAGQPLPEHAITAQYDRYGAIHCFEGSGGCLCCPRQDHTHAECSSVLSEALLHLCAHGHCARGAGTCQSAPRTRTSSQNYGTIALAHAHHIGLMIYAHTLLSIAPITHPIGHGSCQLSVRCQ
jgi:hypothetical protein